MVYGLPILSHGPVFEPSLVAISPSRPGLDGTVYLSVSWDGQITRPDKIDIIKRHQRRIENLCYWREITYIINPTYSYVLY